MLSHGDAAGKTAGGPASESQDSWKPFPSLCTAVISLGRTVGLSASSLNSFQTSFIGWEIISCINDKEWSLFYLVYQVHTEDKAWGGALLEAWVSTAPALSEPSCVLFKYHINSS